MGMTLYYLGLPYTKCKRIETKREVYMRIQWSLKESVSKQVYDIRALSQQFRYLLCGVTGMDIKLDYPQ